MKKHHSMQGTFSRFFGKKHASNNSTGNLFVTNPPWIFTQDVKSDTLASSGEVDGIYFGDNRFGSVTDSGTATLKPRPRVRPLLTFLPLNAQEAHGVAVPTPSVPEGFEDKSAPGLGSQINGSFRKYSSVVDLRPKAFENYLDDEYIPPPPSIPPPPPPPSVDLALAPPSMQAPAPPSVDIPPPPPVAPPPPPPMPPPPPPSKPAQSPSSLAPPSYPYSNLSSPSTPSPPDFIPPTPPLAFSNRAFPPHSPPLHTPPFSNGVSKWKSETVLNVKELDTGHHHLNTPSTHTHNGSQLPQSSPDPHLTFPRSLKIPPPTPVRTSSIPVEEKESSSKDEPFPKMVPHSRPALPPNFTVRTAAAVHLEGEAKGKATLEKPSILITESGNPKAPPGSNDSSGTPHEVSIGKTELPSLDHASSDDDDDNDDWKDRTNLDKLKHELSALLSSSCRKEDCQPDRTVSSKPKTSSTDSNPVVTDGLKQAKPAMSGPQSPPATEGEKKEKAVIYTPSPRKAFTGDAISAPDTRSASMQPNCVMTFKDELEALLSPTKDGGPPLALANLRHNPETKKQVTLQFGGSQVNGGESKFPNPTVPQNNPISGVAEKEAKTSSASSDHSPPDNTQKPPVSPLKPKNGLLVPASPSPASSGAPSPIQTGSPTVDFSLLQYKTHRTKFGSVDSLASAASSQTLEDAPVSANNNENVRDFAEPRSPVTSTLCKNAEEADSEVLIHPVTGEKVEKGSPMALLLAAQQRAQRGRRSAVSSRQNSYLSERPLLKLSEKLRNSSQSETGSSTIYYSDAKPNSIIVVPKSENKSQNVTSSNAYSSSNLVQEVLESNRSKEQDPQIVSEGTTECPRTTSSNHTVNNNEDVEDEFNYDIIPPPPEFSNDAIGALNGSSKGEENHRNINIQSEFQASDKRLNISHSSYDYGNSYSLIPKPVLENCIRPSGYSHDYPSGNYSTSYLSSYSNSRPLIKKRLYVSETDGSYGRAAMSSRSRSTPTTYGHNTMTYNSQPVEGMHRANSTHRNVPGMQGRRVSLELPGKMLTYNNASSDARYKGQSGEYTTSAAAARRPSHGSPQCSPTANTFTVRPGTRQPISYSYQGGLR